MAFENISRKDYIVVEGACENNLKSVDVIIPKNAITVITGISGSGKSSLAFDTIYAEGKRLYLDSVSTYAKQFEVNSRPHVASITGLSPSIAIDQRTISKNPRSTVATITDIYDYLRILFACIGIPHSPATGEQLQKQSVEEMTDKIYERFYEQEARAVVQIITDKKGDHRAELVDLKRKKIRKIIIDGVEHEVDSLPLLDRNESHTIRAVVATMFVTSDNRDAILSAVRLALKIGNGVFCVETKAEESLVLAERFTCPISGFTIEDIEPRIFSFNTPYGACSSCDGLGSESYFSESLIVPNQTLSLREGAIAPWTTKDGKYLSSSQIRQYEAILSSLSAHYGFSLDAPYHSLPQKIQDLLMYGNQGELVSFHQKDGTKRGPFSASFEGVTKQLQEIAEKLQNKRNTEDLGAYKDIRVCTSCSGYGLKQESLCVKVDEKHIGEVCAMSIEQSLAWFSNLLPRLNKVQTMIGDRIIKEICTRLSLLVKIGIGYLTLNRKSMTLSGGEAQRTRLATQIGSGLSGVVYVLDEPSIGLHQSDNDKLLEMLRSLRDLQNTVIVVEHDEDTMKAADWLIDVGPGAGVNGGQIVAMGKPEEVKANENSITGLFLSGKLSISLPEKRRSLSEARCIEVIGARENNLRNVSVKIPTGGLVVVTGVSGSGKSTFVIDTLYKAAMEKMYKSRMNVGKHDKILGLELIDKVIEVDQSPIGRTPRSNPATYTNTFNSIRDLFATLPESKNRGYSASRFSFNVREGRCEVCEGDGALKVEMYFLPDVYVTCDECRGRRYNVETLQILYHGKSISDVLNMTVDEALSFFTSKPLRTQEEQKHVPMIVEKLQTMQDVGLGYIQIGQSATTLSGGEAERIKLSKELSRKGTGRTLYILDEPTSGLHLSDIKRLIGVLYRLVNNGNTVLVIEHNLDVIKVAEHIIDFGPYGGDKGGEVVATGTPEEVALNPNSITGKYLKKYLYT